MLLVAEPSFVCVPAVAPAGLRSAACASGSSVCSTLCAAGSTLPAAYLISHKTTYRKQNQFSPPVTGTRLLLPW